MGTYAADWAPRTSAFVGRLRELGWIEGRTLAIDYRWSEGRPERVAEFATEFVQEKVDVIVSYGTAVAAFKRATTVIPIIFAMATDPVGGGLVASLARPGGNVTGLSLQATDLAGNAPLLKLAQAAADLGLVGQAPVPRHMPRLRGLKSVRHHSPVL